MTQQDAENIKYLFEPRSIAILGASRDKSKIGYAVFNNILSGGYRGNIYPVNPAGGDIEGVPVLHSILEIGEEIDVACPGDAIVVQKVADDDVVNRAAGRCADFSACKLLKDTSYIIGVLSSAHSSGPDQDRALNMPARDTF